MQFKKAILPDYRIIDIGSGAGFPGVPLKIVYPNLNTTLVESQRKRCSFLDVVIHELDLKRIIVINERAEKVFPVPVADAVLLRAVSDINSCLKLATRFLQKGGKVVLKKPPNEKINEFFEGFLLEEEIEVIGYYNKKSNILVFKKCFT